MSAKGTSSVEMTETSSANNLFVHGTSPAKVQGVTILDMIQELTVPPSVGYRSSSSVPTIQPPEMAVNCVDRKYSQTLSESDTLLPDMADSPIDTPTSDITFGLCDKDTSLSDLDKSDLLRTPIDEVTMGKAPSTHSVTFNEPIGDSLNNNRSFRQKLGLTRTISSRSDSDALRKSSLAMRLGRTLSSYDKPKRGRTKSEGAGVSAGTSRSSRLDATSQELQVTDETPAKRKKSRRPLGRSISLRMVCTMLISQ